MIGGRTVQYRTTLGGRRGNYKAAKLKNFLDAHRAKQAVQLEVLLTENSAMRKKLAEEKAIQE